ncbi:hypothetical protein ACWGIU_25850 [Streptomyces sp. NPDC054840]
MDEYMLTAPGLPGMFRIQLFTAPRARSVGLVTQHVGERMSLLNGAERFAAAVWEQRLPIGGPPAGVGAAQLWPEGTIQESRFPRVVFAEASRYRLRRRQHQKDQHFTEIRVSNTVR